MLLDAERFNRQNIGNYREIYVRVSMEVLTQRNQKGLYSTSMEMSQKQNPKGLNKGDGQVAGIHVDIEEPKNPDMVLDNEGNSDLSELVDDIVKRFGI